MSIYDISSSEESWSEIEEFHRTMSTKLNHKNGDKTLQEDLLSERQEKIGEIGLQI